MHLRKERKRLKLQFLKSSKKKECKKWIIYNSIYTIKRGRNREMFPFIHAQQFTNMRGNFVNARKLQPPEVMQLDRFYFRRCIKGGEVGGFRKLGPTPETGEVTN